MLICRGHFASSIARPLRRFSTTAAALLRTSELTSEEWAGLRANSDRLWETIHSTAQWGTGKAYGHGPWETGLSRLTLSDADKQVRDWFVSTTRQLSCETYVDQVGNIFAIRPGCRNDRNVRATFAGSHLDSQPMGGRFDGVLGVAAAVEMLRVLEENSIETEGPVGVVNWTNEEGARFPVSMMGSGVWAGRIPLDQCWKVTEVGGGTRTVREELERIGYLGHLPANHQDGIPMAGHFELHIEQGPKLTKSGEKVGIVDGVQAYKWLTITVQGRESHTGTTPFNDRADALYWASRLIWEVRSIAEREGGLASVGIINAYPGSVNTVPGLVQLTLDVRHPEDGSLKGLMTAISQYMSELSKSSGVKGAPPVTITAHEDFSSNAVKFHPDAMSCVEESAQSVLGLEEKRIRRITSGAGHDSVCTNSHCPTAMIFVPCQDGRSHTPEEWTSQADCAIGASVLLQSVLRFDQFRHQRGDFR